MKKILYTFLIMSLLPLFSCQSLVEGIDDNPNDITSDDVAPILFLTGAELATSSAAVGHLNRIAGMWSGQLVGLSSLYSNIYGYSMSTAESIGTWSRIYIGVVPNVRYIRSRSERDALLQGICKVLEAHAVGMGASIFGDVPYSEINNEEIPDPSFDGQVSVLNAVLALLDEAIIDLGNASSRSIDEDIYYDGDRDRWMEAAYTLKARYYMLQRNYTDAYTAAQNGIGSADGNMQHIPRGDASIAAGDKNTFWEILEGARTGDIGSEGSYLASLLDSASTDYRGNAKTDERARAAYSFVFSTGGSDNLGIIEQFEPQNIVSYEENQLILAEAGARTVDMATGLDHLNDFRVWLNGGGRINGNFSDLPYMYEAYELADFESGGMENADGIAPMRALLREIIEERYVSGFGEFMPFDDARRLRKEDNDISVPFPLNTSAASSYPERMPYSDDELNSNSNAPAEDPGIFSKTEVNQ